MSKIKKDASITRIRANSTANSKPKKEKNNNNIDKPTDSTIKTKIKARKLAKLNSSKTLANNKKFRKLKFLLFLFRPFRPIFRYVYGAYKELRQVKWPSRRASWGLTGSVLAFTAIITMYVLFLDAVFQYIFKTIIG